MTVQTGAAPSPAVRRQLVRAADQVSAELSEQRARWDAGFTRRRFLTGCGLLAAASLGAQLVTTRHAYAAPGTGNGKTLIVVFLRGGFDGLAAVVPGSDPYYIDARPTIGIPQGSLQQLDSTFGLHPALSALYPQWQNGKLAVVHAVAAPFASRSHFQAQEVVERGTETESTSTGWLERALDLSGPGTTFRAVCEGYVPAASLAGADGLITMLGVDSLALIDETPEGNRALSTLYTGLGTPLGVHAQSTLSVLDDAKVLQATNPRPGNGAKYPAGEFSVAMADLARLVKANCGLRMATVDVGGWDVHTLAGGVTGSQADQMRSLAGTVSAFVTDVGTKLADVTVVLMSEFGRRVAENGSIGTDHGTGGAILLLGGGVNGKKVHGQWPGLAPEDLVAGDLAAANDYRDVLGEAAQKTLGLGSISTVFPGHTYRPLGVMR